MTRWLSALCWLLTAASGAVIVTDPAASPAETLAARELHRYLWLRTGVLVPLATALPARGEAFVVARGDRAGLPPGLAAGDLGPQQWLLRRVAGPAGQRLFLLGGDEAGVLYATYRFAERLGVRFYLHGDVVPDGLLPLAIPPLNERGRPLFAVRGIQPFHDFPEGPDWWNRDDWLAVVSQLPKLGLNFVGLHCYPHPEPAVWHGLADDLGPDGQVRTAYSASWQNTLRGDWGYAARRTGEFLHGADQLFDRDGYGPAVMGDHLPRPATPAAAVEVFNAAGALLAEVFAFARRLGVQTCLGTETPLRVPRELADRLRQAGLDPRSPAVVKRLYAGTFERLKRLGAVDHYWLWTPEDWTWQGNTEASTAATIQDVKLALEALDEVRAPFGLATCGWVLGPQSDRALFHRELPRQVPLSCINRQVGNEPVDAAFARIVGRSKWAIPWLEDDPGLTAPQLWAGRMRRDAADALAYGCDGLLGIHWRTRVLAPNVAALAQAAWRQAWSRPEVPKVEGAVGGSVAHFPPLDVADTDLDPLYRTVRYNVNAYRLRVPNGPYRVTLRLVEPHYTEAGKRVFGAALEGRRRFEHLDLFARLGRDRALDLTFDDVVVTDGWLDLDFLRETEYPCLAALDVEGPAYRRRINCGGPAWGAWEADLPVQEDLSRHDPCADFYADWAAAEFGPAAGPAAGALFTRLDGRLPRPATWVDGPGGLTPDGRPWAQVAPEYAFVEELASLRPLVRGPGAADRFEWWLQTFEYTRAMARVRCCWAALLAELAAAGQVADPAARTRQAAARALPAGRDLVQAVADVYDHLLATVSNPGELGTVANWEQHLRPAVLDATVAELAKLLGHLPDDLRPSRRYRGRPRVVVPTVRGSVTAGEALVVRALVLSAAPVTEAWLHHRALGARRWQRLPLGPVARGVWQATLPAASGLAFEYRLSLRTAGQVIEWPATAPAVGQTVVVAPAPR